MVFEHIEKLKQEYTDKYVTVDEDRPELKRFGGMTGTVRTVNMSGRALVEFDAYSNIGWYDIDIDFLKVIDEPLPKPDAKPAAKKAAAKASPKAAPAAKKAEAPAAKAGGGGMSVADMLAAARSNKAGDGGASAGKPSDVAATMEAARKPKGGAAPAKADPKSMSVADMLAAARGEKSGGGAPAAKPAAPAASAPAAAAPKKDPKSMSVAEMLAAARGEKSGGAAPAAAPAPAAEEDPKDAVRDQLESARTQKAAAADDLKLIKGIGPKINDLLIAEGITTFAQLAETPVARLREILEASGSERLTQIANEESWPEQAAAFASGVAPADKAEEAPAEEAPAAESSDDAGESGGRRDDITDPAEQVAYCRKVDAG